MALTLPGAGLCFLAWFCLVPILYLLRGAGGKRAVLRGALLGWLLGLSFHGTALYWVYSTCRFAGIGFPAAAAAWLALAAASGLREALFGAFLAFAGEASPEWAWPFLAAASWAGFEFLFERFTPGLGLILLEYTQWRRLAWIQAASWAGPHGLGFVLVYWNAVLAWLIAAWTNGDRPARRHWLGTACACLLAGAWGEYGARFISDHQALGGGSRRVAILQPDVDQYEKWDASSAARIRAGLENLLAGARAVHPDLILWPESSVPDWVEKPGDILRILPGNRPGPGYHLIGALTRFSGASHNSAVLVDPKGNIAGRYDKRRPVPFGEFVPLRPVFSKVVGLLDQMGDLDAGAKDQPPLRTSWGTIGATICFEAMFPELNRASVSSGTFLLANLTNDGWYKATWGPHQHFHANVFRAVENRLYVLRAANTGISGVIDPLGRVVARSFLGERVLLGAAVPEKDPFPGRSFYARHGDWFGWTSLCVLAFILLAAVVRKPG